MNEFTKARYAALDVISKIESAVSACEELHDRVLDLPDDDDRLTHLARGKYKIADEVRELQNNLDGIWGKIIAQRIREEL